MFYQFDETLKRYKKIDDLETNGKEQAQGLMNSASDPIEGVDVVVRRHALHLLFIAGDLSHQFIAEKEPP